MTTGSRLKQAVCHEPHDKHYKVKGKAQEQGLEWRTEKDGIKNTETRNDDGIDDASIDMHLCDASEVGEARDNAQDDYSRGKLSKTENNRYDFMRNTGFFHFCNGAGVMGLKI